ncbi:glycosyltransferase family 9 protein [Burkholderia sp. Bp8963]|uniref:glycosyltransferase family 9 protein n=1 Tax=Burkholderia sp. Bp8963 TaxID=2184547 RepID=UPI000F599A24|nr:glycosyltransferase family 9 protein [Burkholderia sp. Bp8963]RQS62506.1 glycosyltransferase family 9 protein [Burkholderia sp. Bp8963]
MNGVWCGAQRILCVRLDSIGNVLMTTPAMRALKESGEGRHLTLLTSNAAAPLAGHLPMIDDVWTYDAPWIKYACTKSNPVSDLDMVTRLLTAQFDAAAIFTACSQSALPAALMCWFAGIRLRLAYCRESPYQLLTDHVVESEPHRPVQHEVVRHLALVRAVGATTTDWRMTFDPGYAARRAIRVWLRAALQRMEGAIRPLGGLGRWLVVHPGACMPSRRWPAERFGDTVARLAPLFDGIAVTGSGAERDLVANVCARAGGRVFALAGALSIGELGALIEAADLLISNNSVPVHLAAALGTPVVDLCAMTHSRHTPWHVASRELNVDVPCRNCCRGVCDQPGHPRLLGVGVDDVVRAAHSLLRATARRADRLQGVANACPTGVDGPTEELTSATVSNVIPFASVITRR